MAETKTDASAGDFKEQLSELTKLLGQRAISSIGDRVSGLTDQLNGAAEGGGPAKDAMKEGVKAKAKGDSAVVGAAKGAAGGLKDKVKGAIPGMSSDSEDEGEGGGGGGGDQGGRVVNIIENIDVGVPLSLAYNAWTEYEGWPSFTRKVEHAKQEEDEPTVEFKAQIFLSHRQWTATIQEQVTDERIVWRSTGEKGHVDGAVTFHELGPSLTRILLVLEYHPQGFFEKTANLWRAQGRRARSDFRHFKRHVMINTILDPDSVEGWRGVIHDEEVVRTHEEVVEEEQQQAEEAEDQYDEEEPEEDESEEYDEESEEEPEDAAEEEYDEEEPEEEAEDAAEEPADEPEDAAEEEYEDEPEEEYEDARA